MMLTASLPPARRVQTAAEASVHGMADVAEHAQRHVAAQPAIAQQPTINQVNSGSATEFMATPSNGGPGRRSVRHMARASSGSAMRNRTTATTP